MGFFYVLSLLPVLVLAALAQQFCLPISYLQDARFLILPLVFLCAAVAVPAPGMLLLAFATGLLWDLQQAIILDVPEDPQLYRESVENLSFGFSVLLYALIGALMQGIRPLFQRGTWFMPIMLSGVALFLYRWVEFLSLSFIRGNFVFDNDLVRQLAISAVITMALAPFIFIVLAKLAKLCHYPLVVETKRRKTIVGRHFGLSRSS